MNLLVTPVSQTPIYEQIENQIKEMVLSGQLAAQEQLPSIRLMAHDLKVGVITVKRAYEDLEKEGFLVNVQGKGCFVAAIDKEKIKSIHLEMLRERLSDIAAFAKTAGLAKTELHEIIDELYGGKDLE